jgi:hypothetical protein
MVGRDTLLEQQGKAMALSFFRTAADKLSAALGRIRERKRYLNVNPVSCWRYPLQPRSRTAQEQAQQ